MSSKTVPRMNHGLLIDNPCPSTSFHGGVAYISVLNRYLWLTAHQLYKINHPELYSQKEVLTQLAPELGRAYGRS
jgi:hypothetical protein